LATPKTARTARIITGLKLLFINKSPLKGTDYKYRKIMAIMQGITKLPSLGLLCNILWLPNE
jgi:hypothetical protein